MRREVLFIALSFTAACSLLVDLGGLGDAVREPDAGGGLRDAGTANEDAARDSAPEAAADASDARFCSGAHAFCEDFDDPDAGAFAKWDTVKAQAGTLELDTVDRVSPPSALRIFITPGSGVRDSSLSKNVSVKSRTVSIAFDLRVDTPTSGFGEVDSVSIGLSPQAPGTNESLLAVAHYPTMNRFEYYRVRLDGGTENTVRAVPFASGKFQHYVVTIAPAGATLSAMLSVDGTAVGPYTLDGAALDGVYVQVGASYARDITNRPTVRVDNVVVDTGP